MTDEEWRDSSDPHLMLRRCRGVIRGRPRKGRLYAAACCRQVWHLLTDGRSQAAVLVAERHGDGLADDDELQAAGAAAEAAHAQAYEARGKVGACPEWTAQFAAAHDAWRAAKLASNFARVASGIELFVDLRAQAGLLRCIFGPAAPQAGLDLDSDAPWRTPTVLSLAQAVYESRSLPEGHLDPARLAVLSDALEEAGHPDAGFMAHLRSSGPHVRGCYVVDAALGRW